MIFKEIIIVTRYYGLWMWFPEIFRRIKDGHSSCGGVTSNITMKVLNCTEQVEQDSEVYFQSFMIALANLPGNIVTILVINKLGRRGLLGEIPLVHCLLIPRGVITLPSLSLPHKVEERDKSLPQKSGITLPECQKYPKTDHFSIILQEIIQNHYPGMFWESDFSLSWIFLNEKPGSVA